MGLRLFFLPNFPGATFIKGGMFIPDSRVVVVKYFLFSYVVVFSISRSKILFLIELIGLSSFCQKHLK